MVYDCKNFKAELSLTDKQLKFLGTAPKQVCILAHFIHFVYDAKRSAGELLAG